MIQRTYNLFKALYLFSNEVSLFRPKEIFGNKSVAVIGAAATALEEENGEFIDSFDIVIRVNKALQSWESTQQKYIGKRTDVLYHSFYENDYSGGGPIDFEIFVKDFGLQYLVHPDNTWKGFRTHLNFYKRNPEKIPTYLLSSDVHRAMLHEFGNYIPTVGFSALYSVLTSPCKEVFISGFTFFQSPYVKGYRDHFLDQMANNAHIAAQGLHNPDLELQIFKKLLKTGCCEKVIFDKGLNQILSEA